VGSGIVNNITIHAWRRPHKVATAVSRRLASAMSDGASSNPYWQRRQGCRRSNIHETSAQ
jgi:hypothetical protein